MAKEVELLSAAKWAAKLEASPGKVKKLIKEMEIEPDLVKGKCNYYSEKTINKIKKAL